MVIFLIFGMLFFTSCAVPEDKQIDNTKDQILLALKTCTGTCLTREEMAQLVYNYEKVQSKWSGMDLINGKKTPQLELVTPGEHEHNENTRYEITVLDQDEDGFYKGLKVSVMDDTSACKIEQTET